MASTLSDKGLNVHGIIESLKDALSNKPLVIAMGIPLGLGVVVGFSTLPKVFTWYKGLKKPKWTPPAPVIGQVWSVLYGCMGYASYLVWKEVGWPSAPLTLYSLQLSLNLFWQLLFFIGQRPDWAQLENITLLTFVTATMAWFWKINPQAGKLMLPYWAWTLLANVLNFNIWKKNPKESEFKPDTTTATS